MIAPQVNPAGTVSVKETAPAKPPCAVIVIVDVIDWPTVTAAGELAAMVKSCAALTVKVAVAECVKDPLVPVNVNV